MTYSYAKRFVTYKKYNTIKQSWINYMFFAKLAITTQIFSSTITFHSKSTITIALHFLRLAVYTKIVQSNAMRQLGMNMFTSKSEIRNINSNNNY